MFYLENEQLEILSKIPMIIYLIIFFFLGYGIIKFIFKRIFSWIAIIAFIVILIILFINA